MTATPTDTAETFTITDVPPPATHLDHLAAGWGARAQRAVDLVQHASIAPGLFDPATVEQAIADYGTASAQATRWTRITQAAR